MDRVTVIKSQDRRKIDKVIFSFPELMGEGAEEEIRKEYQELLDTGDKLQEAREKVREYENLLNKKKEAFNAKSSLFTLEFVTIEKQHITHETSITLQGMGNDIIGRQTSL